MIGLMEESVPTLPSNEVVPSPIPSNTDSHVVEAGTSDDAIVEVLQQMIDSPESFSLDTIDDVSFPGRFNNVLSYRLRVQ